MKTIQKEQARMRKRACRPQINGRKITVPTRNGSMSAFVYNKRNCRPGYLIVEVHGGGFMYNTAADDDDFCCFIHERLGIPVVSCDYSLSPHAPFPTGLEDVYDCIKYALTLPSLNAAPDKIILWGHSAGANLAAGAAYLSTKSEDFTPCLQILDYPYMDVWRKSYQRPEIKYSVSGKLMDTFAHYYTPEASDLRDILISPILHSSSSFRNMPPTFLLLCGRDNLNEGGKYYGRLLKKAGVPVTFYYVKEALHGYIENHFNYKYLPFLTKIPVTKKQHRLAQDSVNHICDWIEKETTE
ncbi:MAG: alpha/beta hydrolase fold domain-containing protein [Eubacteriales bacterium]|nr:alpha/beta hydrolase fold domain-containing protein [Eubacteriales bacterium]